MPIKIMIYIIGLPLCFNTANFNCHEIDTLRKHYMIRIPQPISKPVGNCLVGVCSKYCKIKCYNCVQEKSRKENQYYNILKTDG